MDFTSPCSGFSHWFELLITSGNCSDDSEDGEDTVSGWKIGSFPRRYFVFRYLKSGEVEKIHMFGMPTEVFMAPFNHRIADTQIKS